MFEKIKKIVTSPYIQQFRDVRALGLAAFAVVAVLVSWSGVKAIQTNYELQKQISKLEQKNQVQKLENENLKLRNKYLNTDQFLELAARRQFGLARPGEKVYLVPKTIALAHTIDTSSNQKQVIVAKDTPKRPTYQRHFEAWVNFFFHRQSTSNSN